MYCGLYTRCEAVTHGRYVAQAVSCRLPTTAARVRAQVRPCGICGEQSDTGAGFLRLLRFPLPILIPPPASHASSIIRGRYNRQNRVRRAKWTQSDPTPRNKEKTENLDVYIAPSSSCS
jgi:hypothetical protein